VKSSPDWTFVGVSYQYFDFDKVDGVDLRNLGASSITSPSPAISFLPTTL
jgi:hypothetical protein